MQKSPRQLNTWGIIMNTEYGRQRRISNSLSFFGFLTNLNFYTLFAFKAILICNNIYS
jgi:hypothetical protein